MAGISKAEMERRDKAVKEAVAQKENEIDALKQMMEQMQAQMQAIMNKTPLTEVAENIKSKKQERKKIPLDVLVPVKSNVEGELVYVSKKTGYTVTWEEYGAPEYMEISELLAMRNGNKAFYENNWIVLDDADDYTAQEILDFLQVSRYYVNTLTEEDIDDLLSVNKSVEDMKAIIEKAPKAIKDTIASKALKMIDDLSNGKIKALEEVLKVELRPQ